MFNDAVLIRILRFSCNYRDKSLLQLLAQNAEMAYATEPAELAFCSIGSDFVAEVINKGDGVTDLEIGDLVIPDSTYPISTSGNIPEGIPTNEYSTRLNQYTLIESLRAWK